MMVLTLAEPLLEQAATKIVCLSQLYLPDRSAKLIIRDVRLPGSFAKPGCFEYRLGFPGVARQFWSVALGATA
jgi:hypothetical protein